MCRKYTQISSCLVAAERVEPPEWMPSIFFIVYKIAEVSHVSCIAFRPLDMLRQCFDSTLDLLVGDDEGPYQHQVVRSDSPR